MAKYKNYKELAAAFKSGELPSKTTKRGDHRGYFLVLDKGGAQNSLTFHDPKLSEEENERRQNECIELFDPEYGVEDLFDALGVPWEWC